MPGRSDAGRRRQQQWLGATAFRRSVAWRMLVGRPTGGDAAADANKSCHSDNWAIDIMSTPARSGSAGACQRQQQ